MPPTNRQELVGSIENDSRRATNGGTSNPADAANTASSCEVRKTRRDGTVVEWRSERVRIDIPVDVCVCAEDEEPVFARGKTVDVSAHGALLDVKMQVDVGQTLRLVNVRTKREIECHVLRFAKRYPEGGGEIAVDFVGRSQHFWGIASPPADWDPNWVPNGVPQSPGPMVPPSRPVSKDASDHSSDRIPGAEKATEANSGAGRATVKQNQKSWRAFKWPMVAVAASAGMFMLWTVAQRSGSGANEDSSAFQVAPEDAGAIPGIGHLRLATPVEFDHNAATWLRSSGQSVSGKIPGFYSGSNESNAYILVGQDSGRHVVILADGGLRYRADYPVVAVAARVPKELVHNIRWADPSPPQYQGDGLLIVRAADDPASGVILFLQGEASLIDKDSIVQRGHPVDYRNVPVGRAP